MSVQAHVHGCVQKPSLCVLTNTNRPPGAGATVCSKSAATALSSLAAP